ncbi:hypothetical protein BSIN_4118 [Burkholderia singularis]|uniref:Uncharacterized protein n=1 Tax=Burkholderia singularis TaxID=1503053 RepID=A0A238HBB7_9BURK|nr:hypothetical protein BSIN_4118 [Burkholderia singularis]
MLAALMFFTAPRLRGIASIAILTIARNAAPLPPATHTLRTRGGIYLIS